MWNHLFKRVKFPTSIEEKIRNGRTPVDGSEILHWDVSNNVNNGNKLPTSTGARFLPSTVFSTPFFPKWISSFFLIPEGQWEP